MVSLLLNSLFVLQLWSQRLQSSLPPHTQNKEQDSSLSKLMNFMIWKRGLVIESPQQEDDDNGLQELLGKSCLYSSGLWRCQECIQEIGEDGKNTANDDTAITCRRLQPKGICHAFRQQSWNNPTPQSFSIHDQTSNGSSVQMRALRKVQHRNKFYDRQPLCTVSSPYCFDLSKCQEHVLTVYTNDTNGTPITTSGSPNENVELIQYVSNKTAKVQQVDRFEDACLSITFPTTYTSAEEMRNTMHWENGRNNLLWGMNHFDRQFKGAWNGDNPFQNFHVERAAVASDALNRPSLRPGYDQVLPLIRQWGRPVPPNEVDIFRKRKWLLTFRGGIQNVGTPYYHHRWLASEYWQDDDDIFIDVSCRRHRERVTYKRYKYPKSIYPDLMWNSTFGFAPGGAGVSSYRFSEMLSTATIPVVVDDMVPPLSPELDWSGCIVRISETRIIDLPRILRESFTAEDIAKRQKRCWDLHELVLGEYQVLDTGKSTSETPSYVWKDDPRVTFMLAMKVWAARVSHAIRSVRVMGALQY